MNPLDIIQPVYHILLNMEHYNPIFCRFGEAIVARISHKSRRKNCFNFAVHQPGSDLLG